MSSTKEIEPIVLSKREVAKLTGLSPSTIYRLGRDNNFPKPRMLAPNRIGWLAQEVREWVEIRPVRDGMKSDLME